MYWGKTVGLPASQGGAERVAMAQASLRTHQPWRGPTDDHRPHGYFSLAYCFFPCFDHEPLGESEESYEPVPRKTQVHIKVCMQLWRGSGTLNPVHRPHPKKSARWRVTFIDLFFGPRRICPSAPVPPWGPILGIPPIESSRDKDSAVLSAFQGWQDLRDPGLGTRLRSQGG